MFDCIKALGYISNCENTNQKISWLTDMDTDLDIFSNCIEAIGCIVVNYDFEEIRKQGI